MKPYIPALIILVVALLALGIWQIVQPSSEETLSPQENFTTPSPSASPAKPSPSQTVAPTPSQGITLQEVARHNNENDCWMAIGGKVYNVTPFITQHPGGDSILNGCGKDATEMFASVGKHQRGSAQNELTSAFIGNLTR